MKRFSVLFIVDIIILIIGIFSIVGWFVFEQDTFVFQTFGFACFYMLCTGISWIFHQIKKKNGIEVLTTDLEPEKLLNNVSKWKFLYSPYERTVMSFLSYQALYRPDLALETLNRARDNKPQHDYYLAYIEASDYCRCYIALNNREQADICLNYCRDVIKNLQLEQQKRFAYFFLEFLEHYYALRFDSSYVDFDYYERLLNPDSGTAPTSFYSNYNILAVRYNLGKIYLRLGMFDRADFNFRYVADNGKNLPIAYKSRNYLMHGITQDL